MVELKQYKKDMNYKGYDKVYEDAKVFEQVLPFMKPKLEGSWNILILEPDLEFIRTCLDTGYIPSYIHLVIAVEPAQLQRLYLERPKLVEEDKSSWDIYMALVANFPNPIDNRALREIYYRCGPREDRLQEALNSLLDVPYVTMHDVNKRWAPVRRVYANTVVRTLLTGSSRTMWRQLAMLESEVGTRVAFYAMRKAVRKLFKAKVNYLNNIDVKEHYIDQVSVYDLTFLYWLFEEATTPTQLYPVIFMYEGRRLPNAGNN